MGLSWIKDSQTLGHRFYQETSLVKSGKVTSSSSTIATTVYTHNPSRNAKSSKEARSHEACEEL